MVRWPLFLPVSVAFRNVGTNRRTSFARQVMPFAATMLVKNVMIATLWGQDMQVVSLYRCFAGISRKPWSHSDTSGKLKRCSFVTLSERKEMYATSILTTSSMCGKSFADRDRKVGIQQGVTSTLPTIDDRQRNKMDKREEAQQAERQTTAA